MATPRVKAPDDTIFVYPSETVFSHEEWTMLLAGAHKTSLRGARELARKQWSLKFKPRRLRKKGPRGNGHVAVAQQTRQHYLWLFQQLLGQNDQTPLTDVEVCERVCVVVFNFRILRLQGLIISPDRLARLNNLRFALSQEDSEHHWSWVLKDSISEVRRLGHEAWKALQEGRIKLRRAGAADPISQLINLAMATLLEMRGDMFQMFQDPKRRLRKSKAGRPTKSKFSITITSAEGSNQTYRQKTRPKLKSNPPAEEAEVLQRALSELLYAKNLVFLGRYLRVSDELSRWIAEANEPNESSDLISWGENALNTLELLHETGNAQRVTPWDSLMPFTVTTLDICVPSFGT